MLVDLKLESHNAKALCDTAKILGIVSSVEEIYEKKPENCVLVGKIIRIGELRRNNGFIMRDFFEFSMKELCTDGKYGQDFQVFLFGKIATEVASAKFMLSDKLIFSEPQVFANPQYDNQLGHKLHVQVGLRPGEVGAIWYSRKYSEELAVVHASPRKLTVSNNNKDEPCCSSNNNNLGSSRFAKENLITATEKNKIHHKCNPYNTNNSIFSKSANWIGKSNKANSNIINKRLLFARNSENPFISDSEHNSSYIQADARETTTSLVNKNNAGKDTASTTCDVEQNQTLSKYFNRNSPAKHTVLSKSVTKPAASESDKRKYGGCGIDEENELSDYSTILEQVSDVMKQKYLSCAGQTKSSTKKESLKKVLEVNRNVVEEVILDGDDCEETGGGTQQSRNTTSFNNRKTSLKSVHVSPKKTKINNNERPVNTNKIFDKQNSSTYDKTKQTVVFMSGDGDYSPEKASTFISKVNNNNHCNDGSEGTQPLNVEKNVDFEGRANTNVCDRKVVNNKIRVSNNQAESNNSCSAGCRIQSDDDNVRRKHEKWLHNLELLESLLNEDDEKEGSENATTADRIVLTQSCDACHEAVNEDEGDSASKNDNVSVTTANKTKKLIPAIKSHSSVKQDCGDGSKRGCKKRVSFQFSDEENENVCEENYSSDDNSMSLLAGRDCVEIDVVLNNRQLSSKSSGSRRDCVATEVSEKCSMLNENGLYGSGETDTKGTVEEPLLHNKSSHTEIQNTLGDANNSDNTVVCTEHSVEIAKNHDRAQSVDTEENLLYLNDCVEKNNCFVKTILLINNSQGGSNTSSSSVTDNILVKAKQNVSTTVVPCSRQDSVAGHVGTKRKHDDKSSSDYDYSEYNNSDLLKVQRLVSELTPISQLSTNVGSSCNLEVNCSLLSVRRDVGVNTDADYNHSESDKDSDISDDPSGSWSIISGSLIDVYPPLTGNTLDLVSGYCDHNCFHKFTELAWAKNSNGVMVEPFCPAAFGEGIQRVPQLMFMFTLVVTDDEGKCHNLRVCKEHAEFFLGCKATEYVNDKVKRTRIIDGLKSYITASTDSLMSETVNKKILRLCTYNKGSLQIVVRGIRSSTLKLT